MAASPHGNVVAIRARIRGRVQGVGYRDWTMRRADALGLRGWVRNRSDGSVEALFIGPQEVVDRMVGDCRRGPSMARVEAIETQADIVSAGDTFAFRPTI
jgi:acylphosphatase